jgi:four helix bundle protein
VEFRRYVIMAMGSADETQLWCRYAADLGYMDSAEAAGWASAYGEIARMLQGLATSAGSASFLIPDH